MKTKKMKTNSRKEKVIAVSQIISLVLEIFAFSFIIGGMAVLAGGEEVSADSYVPQGCCLEAVDGSICQEMNLNEAAACKSALLATDCDLVETCQPGCCYNKIEGTCSLNSPKQKCEENGGNWSSSKTCAIQECTLGCCVIGDQASITTTRECTTLSRNIGVEKNFQSLDADGGCDSKTDLATEGACVFLSDDFSGENNCKFTTKEQCQSSSGKFYEDFLCTAKALNTTCFPAKKTTCVEGKDEIYYLDTCDNLANVYDANKFSDQAYWEKVMEPSCAKGSASCGNCDYAQGSRCEKYREGKDTKPVFGDNVCRNLNCENGRKHGESWCISDYSNTETPGVAPVGSRWFVGSCVDGEISIKGCADYNNEVCISSEGTGEGGSSFTEAKCVTNGWRSCMAANDKGSYDEVKSECDKYPDDCVMFLDIEGNGKYSGLPGFNPAKSNAEQGSAGDVQGSNSSIPWCVPKYTPGLVFWADSSSENASKSVGTGGSLEETAAICNIASFTCVSHTQKKPAATGSWKDKENPECNIDAHDQSKQKVSTMMEAFNERCNALGPCGVSVNIAGDLGSNNGSSVSRTKINSKGKSYAISAAAYILSEDYKNTIKEAAGIIPAGSINQLTGAVIGAFITGQVPAAAPAAGAALDAAYSLLLEQEAVMYATGELGSVLPSAGLSSSLTGAGGMTAAEIGMSSLYVIGWAATAAMAGYTVGKMIGKGLGMTPGEIDALSIALAVAGGVGGAAVSAAVYFELGAKFGWYGILVAAVLAVITYLFTGEDNEYYVMTYTCEPWTPPKEGDCSLCNDDIRPCSEYRCKSLGLNCDYYTDNGEPGYCASTSEIWSATIKPWPEALTEGNRYSDVAEMHFSITGSGSDGKVEAWKNLQWGIITDKPAQCKIDNKHTASYDEMSTEMFIDAESCETSACISGNQGLKHKIVLSQSIGNNSNYGAAGIATLGMVEGENNYYIRCKNFAGQTNTAEFAVKIIVDEGPDYSPPIIESFVPESGSYVKMGENSSSVILWVNEPAQCRYSQGADSRFEDMTENISCMTSPESAVLGAWPCYAYLRNLTVGENNFYFQCQDQPELEEARNASIRNINRNSKNYVTNVCSTGLNITSIIPEDQIVAGKPPVTANLQVETIGCINGGEASCSYSFSNSTGGFISFYETGGRVHKQDFTNLVSGDYDLGIYCEDKAGNSAEGNASISVFLDEQVPFVVRHYINNRQLNIITNEDAECKYTSNSTIGCSFDYDSSDSGAENISLMSGTGTVHLTPWIENQRFYIKCKDEYGNKNLDDCAIQITTW